MPIPRSLASVADLIVPVRGDSASVERFRARAMALTLVLSITAAVTTAPVYWLAGMWFTCVAAGVFALIILALLLVFRRGLSTNMTFNCLLGLTAFLLMVTSCTESPLESSSLSWSIIFPVSGFLLAGLPGGTRGAVAAVVFTVFAIVVHAGGWVLDVQGPVTSGAVIVRFLSLFGAVTAMTATFEVLRSQAMSEAEHSNRAKSLFLANMSHELRTPMNGVLGLTELVLLGRLEADQRERLELVQRSGNALIGIIDNILHLTKIESGGLRLEHLPISLPELIDDIVALHRPAARTKGLSLTADLSPTVPARIVGDPTRLSQIINNLLGNAIKFTAQGSVVLSAQVVAQTLKLSVRDTGIGIPAEAQTNLFKNFQQIDETFTRRFGGTGLGLAISRQIALAMGGNIEVESQAGHGSTFTLTLPVVVCELPSLNEAPLRPRPALIDPSLPVLIVDDNGINLRVARGFVERLGLRVETAVNGLEAVERASAERFLFVLMDCHMPELDGFQATERIRALPAPFSQVPIVALTASVLTEDLEACRRAGMNQVLAKPLNYSALEALAQQVIANAA